MSSGRTFKGHIFEHRDGLCRMVLHFFAKLSIFTAMELDFGRLPYKTSLEPEKHEKQGPEVRYRIYLDDLDRF